jgi:hypothetical protein
MMENDVQALLRYCFAIRPEERQPGQLCPKLRRKLIRRQAWLQMAVCLSDGSAAVFTHEQTAAAREILAMYDCDLRSAVWDWSLRSVALKRGLRIRESRAAELLRVLFTDVDARLTAVAKSSLGAALGIADAENADVNVDADTVQWCAVVRHKIHPARTNAALHFSPRWPHRFEPGSLPPPVGRVIRGARRQERVLSLALVAADAKVCELAAPLVNCCLRRLV